MYDLDVTMKESGLLCHAPLGEDSINAALTLWNDYKFKKIPERALLVVPPFDEWESLGMTPFECYLAYAKNSKALSGSLVVLSADGCKIFPAGGFISPDDAPIFKQDIKITYAQAGGSEYEDGQLLADAIAGQLKALEMMSQ